MSMQTREAPGQDSHSPGQIPFLRHIASIVLLLLLVLGIVGVNPLRQTLAPMDLLLAYPGWDNAGVDTPLVNAERSDALDHRLPNWREFRRELWEGHIPLWNPLHQLGSVGIQAPIYEGLSIPFLVYALTPNEAMGYTFAILANYFLAAVGTYLLLVFMFRNQAAAVFGAIVFSFCGFNIAWAHWPHLTTSALIPWVLATQLRYWQTGRLGWALGFAFSVALMGLGGFPFVAILGAISSLILAVVLLIDEFRSTGINRLTARRVIGLGCAGTAGAFLALPGLLQVKNILDSTDLSSRTSGTAFTPYDLIYMFGSDFADHLGVERTFSAGLPAAILAIISIYFIFRSPNIFSIFGAIVSIFTIATAFGAAPARLVALIPGFSLNTWSRASILFGLSVSILSSFSFYRLFSYNFSRNSHITIFSYFIIAIQCANLWYWFGQVNSKPDISTFFPDTPSISYALGKIRPGQSIVADDSFLISGFLSNYQLPELFSHGFRTDAQNKIATDIAPSFQTTYTASAIQCSDINFLSRNITYAGVRFFLVKNGCTTELAHETTGSGHRPTVPLNNGDLEGDLPINNAMNVMGVQVLFGTYDQDYGPSALIFELYHGGSLVARTEIPPEAVRNNQFATFGFARDVHLVAGTYRYVISMANRDSQRKLSAWAFETAGGATYQVGPNVFPGIPKLKVIERTQLPQNFTTTPVEPGIDVIENHEVSGSGYYVTALNGQPDADYDSVNLVAYRPDDITLEYTGTSPGWVVFPMRANKHWRATLERKPVELGRFLNFFPAVQVNGRGTIRFYYDISYLLRTLELCMAGFAAAVFLLIAVNGRASKPRTGAA